MSMEPTIDRLSAYLDDELSKDEREDLERQLESSPSLRAQIEKLRQVRDWLRDYPGRKPQADAWRGIAARISDAGTAAGAVSAESPTAERSRSGGFALFPAFASAGMFTAAKRVGIGALVLFAIGGMGRQFVLEQRADKLVHTIELRDVQLLKYANSWKWSMTASAVRGEIGRRIQVLCPSGGTPQTIWGTGVYTDDSGVCTAGVHSGAISLEEGGLVTIEIRPGQDEYLGSAQNGIVSEPFGRWHGSFVIVGPDADRRVLGLAEMDAGATSWDASAIELRGLNGSLVSFSCPADGEDRGPIWGTGVYTDDSSICTSAVHAGLITFENGGDVVIRLVPGQGEYEGSTRNGVMSLDHPEWSGSFVFEPLQSIRRDPPTRRERRERNLRPVRPTRPVLPQVTVDVDPPVIDVSPPLIDVSPPLIDVNPIVIVGVEGVHRIRERRSVAGIGWETSAVEIGISDGSSAELRCPAGGTRSPIWGTDTYTDGSSICTAAVHAGLITFEEGGLVSIEMLPGQRSYPGTGRNGVYSSTLETSEPWRGSFTFVRQ